MTFVSGLRQVLASKRLVLVCWTWMAALAVAAGLPIWRWLASVTALAPEADRLLDRFNVATLGEFVHYDRSPVLAIAQAGAIGALLLAVVSGALLMGGALAVMAAPDSRGSILPTFLAGAGRRFWPFLRLVLFGRGLALVLAALAAAPVSAVLGRLDDNGWPYGMPVQVAVTIGVFLLVVTPLLAAVDVAMIHLAESDSRRGFRAWWRGVRFVLGRPLTILWLWASAGLVLVAAGAVYWWIWHDLPAATYGWILLAVVLQQAFVVLRTAIRLAVVAAERDLYRALAGEAVGPAAPVAGDTSGVHDEDQVGPGEHGGRQVDTGQNRQDPVEGQEVQ